MLTALLVFPCGAVLWLMICDRLGLVADQPIINYPVKESSPDSDLRTGLRVCLPPRVI